MSIRSSRRDFIGQVAAASVAALLATRAGAQPLRPVRLMAVRRPSQIPSSACTARCIRGRVYDVSDTGDRPLDATILPLLMMRQPICDTIERPWKDNAPNVSSIPAGVYQAVVRQDATKPWMTTLDRRWRLELVGTGPRSRIQFHYGQDEKWSEGCFIVGDLLNPAGTISDADYCKLQNGEAAIARLRAAVMAPGANSQSIAIGVCDDAGLFPNFKPAPPCSTGG
jgi:hypothetical protein